MDVALKQAAPSFVKRSRIGKLPEDLRPNPREICRFFQFCDNISPGLDRCINWRGHFNGRTKPYPQFWFRRKNRNARHMMWLWFGEGKVDDLERFMIRTSCGALTCMNPLHLKKHIRKKRRRCRTTKKSGDRTPPR